MVNWPVVELAEASVVLVADIDRGGIFAQVIGTLDLLAPHERQRVLGVIVNKFRGDCRLFEDGVRILEARTGLPILFVIERCLLFRSSKHICSPDRGRERHIKRG